MEMLTRNLGGIINALAFVAVAFLVVWFGMRPLARQLGFGGQAGKLEGEAAGLELPDFSPAGAGAGGALMEGFGSDFGFDGGDDLLNLGDEAGFNRRSRKGRSGASPGWSRSAKSGQRRYCENGQSTERRERCRRKPELERSPAQQAGLARCGRASIRPAPAQRAFREYWRV